MDVLVDFVNQPNPNPTRLVEIRRSTPVPEVQQAVLELLVVLQVVEVSHVRADDNLRSQFTRYG
ncbi:hypothetical protein D3C80_2112530 [compost metagenome]